jgi:hypothetical protein
VEPVANCRIQQMHSASPRSLAAVSCSKFFLSANLVGLFNLVWTVWLVRTFRLTSTYNLIAVRLIWLVFLN